ncbi:hypothetical protein ABH935_009996 [Catenulispora sp. GAS73]|uniref:DUF6542 domain-containing protein n=1 Tax=Catenulispora sp. GAS73 TaxID=3156269 RepID=UPI0035144B8E
MNEGASRLAPRPARVPQTRRDRDALRRERMAAPLDFRSTGPTRPRPQSRSTAQTGNRTGTAARSAKRRQALTAWGVLLMVTGPTVAAAALEALVTGDVHWFFDLVFVAASFHAATLVRRRDLLAGVIVPPLAYCAGLLTAVQFGVMRAGHGLIGELASLGALLAVKPRPLFLGTALAAALIAARWAGMRSAAKR